MILYGCIVSCWTSFFFVLIYLNYCYFFYWGACFSIIISYYSPLKLLFNYWCALTSWCIHDISTLGAGFLPAIFFEGLSEQVRCNQSIVRKITSRAPVLWPPEFPSECVKQLRESKRRDAHAHIIQRTAFWIKRYHQWCTNNIICIERGMLYNCCFLIYSSPFPLYPLTPSKVVHIRTLSYSVCSCRDIVSLNQSAVHLLLCLMLGLYKLLVCFMASISPYLLFHSTKDKRKAEQVTRPWEENSQKFLRMCTWCYAWCLMLVSTKYWCFSCRPFHDINWSIQPKRWRKADKKVTIQWEENSRNPHIIRKGKHGCQL